MRKVRWIKYLSLLGLPFLLTGCWDSVELNERHVVLEVALDKNPKVDLSKPIGEQERYTITYSIPDMLKLSGEDSLGENVKNNITTRSATIAKSVDEIETKTQNTVSFSHTKAIVLGEELLRDKELFKGAIDALLRNKEVGRSTIVLATHDMAGELTKANNAQNPIIGMYVMKYFNNGERPASYAKGQMLGNLIKELNDTGVSTIPLITNNEEDTMQIKGAALIKDYQLVDWLNQEEVRGELFVEGKIKGVPIIVDYQGKALTYIIEEEKSKIKFKNNNGTWECYIDVTTTGNVTEYISSSDQNIFNQEHMDEVTKLLQKEITKQIATTVNKSKEINIDFLNIGLEMYRKHPKEWGKYKETWGVSSYKTFPIHTTITVNIQNTGVLQ